MKHPDILTDLMEKLTNGTLRVNIVRTFSLDRITDAHTCLEDQSIIGKIVVVL
jgi:NADPH:quinone reductase-like Zn-dependent oxidoreductase